MRIVAEDNTLPYIPLSEDRKDELAKIMQSGNKVLKRLYEQVVEKTGMGTKTYSRATFRDELVSAMKKGQVNSIRGMEINSEDLAKIQAVTDVSMELLCGYTRCIEKLSYLHAYAHPNAIMGFQDYYDEGIIGAINAIYYYTNTNVSFFTYLYHCVRRKLANSVNKNNPLSPWSNKARKLHMLYEEARAEFNRPVTFDEVANYLGFNDEERAEVQATLVEVYHGTGLSKNQCVENPTDVMDLDQLAVIQELRTHRPLLNEDQRDVVRETTLTYFENEVFKAFQNPYSGWQVDVARDNINPGTGKPYSRQAVQLALNNALVKVKKTKELLEQQEQRASA